LYDLAIKTFIDDEALEWDRSSSILCTTTFSISHMWPYQIHVWINIIVSNEYWWENGIILKNQINLMFGVMLIDF
jgi:hypothetical protein